MPKANEERVKAAADILTQYMMEKRCRKTPERYALIEAVYTIGEAFSVDSLQEFVADKMNVSRVTVYNNLEHGVRIIELTEGDFGFRTWVRERSLSVADDITYEVPVDFTLHKAVQAEGKVHGVLRTRYDGIKALADMESEGVKGESKIVASPRIWGDLGTPDYGYTFEGWTSSDVTISGGSFTMPAKAVGFEGSFTADSGTPYKVEVKREDEPVETTFTRPAAPRKASAAPAQQATSHKASDMASGDGFRALAPLPGTIMQIFVKEGDQVKRGDKLLMYEAMKMENNFLAEKEGVIKDIKVKVGDNVLQGAVLFVIG